MIRVFYDAGAIFIDGRDDPMPAGTLVATSSGSTISISSIHGAAPLVSCDVTQIADINGAGFASAAAAMAYLVATFARPMRLYQDVLVITVQNVIPPLTFPWKSGPGAFANIIVGAATFTNGDDVVAFSDGSDVVSFDPSAAGFNLNPTETVIAQYSYQG